MSWKKTHKFAVRVVDKQTNKGRLFAVAYVRSVSHYRHLASLELKVTEKVYVKTW
jgi:hypothetical protein